jgi:hypothetical protein
MKAFSKISVGLALLAISHNAVAGQSTNTNNVAQPQNRRPVPYQQAQQPPPSTQKPQQPQPFTQRPPQQQPQVRPPGQTLQQPQSVSRPAQTAQVPASRPTIQQGSAPQPRQAPTPVVAQVPHSQPQLSPNPDQQGRPAAAESAQGQSSRRREVIFVERPAAPQSVDTAPTNPAPQPATAQSRQKPDFAAILNGFANVISAANNKPSTAAASESPKAEKAASDAAQPSVDPKLMAGAFHQLAAAERDKVADLLKNQKDTEALAAIDKAKKYEDAARQLEASSEPSAPAATDPAKDAPSGLQKILESDGFKKALEGIAGALTKKAS